MNSEASAKGMASIGGAVALAAALSPRFFLRLFGIGGSEVTGAAEFGWRLFAVRTGYLSVAAARGDEAARRAFLPVQVMDQAVFWHAYLRGRVPLRATAMASAASAGIIALDRVRRR